MLLFPPFYTRNEFSGLHPSLKVVPYGLRLESLQRALTTAEVNRDTILAKYSKSDAVAKDQILALMTEAMVPADNESRQRFLRRALDQFKTLHASGMRTLNHQEIRDLIFRLFTHYQSLNYERFGADFAAVASTTDSEVEAEISNAANEVLKAQRAVEKHLLNVSKVFINNQAPDAWEGMSGPSTAEIVVREFLSRWRTRAPLFEVPVSVSGVAIHTMEPTRREVWEQAYKALKLDEKPRRPVYRFVIEPKIAVATTVDHTEGLPPIFTEQGIAN